MNKATATRTATTAQMIAAITPPLNEPFLVPVSPPKYQRKHFRLVSFLKYMLHVYFSSMTICFMQGGGGPSRQEQHRVHFRWLIWVRRSKSASGNGPGGGGSNLLGHQSSRVRKAEGSALSRCFVQTENTAFCQAFFGHFHT